VAAEEPRQTAYALVVDAAVLGQKDPALFEAGDVFLLHLFFEGLQSFFGDALFFAGRSVKLQQSNEATMSVAFSPASKLATAVAEYLG
jgi:hypothetical protein